MNRRANSSRMRKIMKQRFGNYFPQSDEDRAISSLRRQKERIKLEATMNALMYPNPPPKGRIPKIIPATGSGLSKIAPPSATTANSDATTTSSLSTDLIQTEVKSASQNQFDSKQLSSYGEAYASIGEDIRTSLEKQNATIVLPSSSASALNQEPSDLLKGIRATGAQSLNTQNLKLARFPEPDRRTKGILILRIKNGATASKNLKVTFDPAIAEGTDTSNPSSEELSTDTSSLPLAPQNDVKPQTLRKSIRTKSKSSSRASFEPVKTNKEKLESKPQQHGDAETTTVASQSGKSVGDTTVPKRSRSISRRSIESKTPHADAKSDQKIIESEAQSSLDPAPQISVAEAVKVKQAIAKSLLAENSETITLNSGTIQDRIPIPRKASAKPGNSKLEAPMVSYAQDKLPHLGTRTRSKRLRNQMKVRENEIMISLEMFETTQRTTLPYRVHQLWDCIQHTTAGTASLDIEKLVSIAAAIHKIPRDELNTDLQSAIKDGLIISEVVKNKGVESEVYSLPDPNTVNKGDHDWYCFKCHLGGPVVQCEDCPRVFHMNCLEEDRKPQQDLFVCPPCHFIATKPSMEKVNIKQKQLNTLLNYICDRIHDWNCVLLEKLDAKAWAQATHRPTKESWRLNHFVYFPMDMSMINEKTNASKYTSLEEFQVDCETLVHAIGCFFGSDLLKGVGIGGAFLRDIIHDINEIKLCHDCFRRSNEKDHPWWFCLPCATEHSVVWAKQAGYPYWPAKVMKQDGNKYDVRYFGGSYERGIVDVKNIMPIETSLATLKVRKTAAWTDAYDELQKFMEIAKDHSLIDKLPSRGKSTPGKSAVRRSGAKTEEVVAKKSRASEPAKSSAMIPKARQATKSTSSSPAVAPKTPKPVPLNTAQSNGMSTLKKNVASPKPVAHGAGEPANAAASTPALVLNIEPTLLEYSDELKSSFARDCARGAGSANGAPADVDGVPAENTVSSSNESQTAENPVNAVVPDREFGESVLGTVAKYTDIITEKYNQDISAVKRKQWCFNCEREAIYHCCWNTAYCSTGCQQLHWTKEHKRLCRRFKRDRHGNLLQNQPSSDDF